MTLPSSVSVLMLPHSEVRERDPLAKRFGDFMPSSMFALCPDARVSSSYSALESSQVSRASGSTTSRKSRTVSSTRRTTSTARTSQTRTARLSLQPRLRKTLLQLARNAISPKHAPLDSSVSTSPSSTACARPTSRKYCAATPCRQRLPSATHIGGWRAVALTLAHHARAYRSFCDDQVPLPERLDRLRTIARRGQLSSQPSGSEQAYPETGKRRAVGVTIPCGPSIPPCARLRSVPGRRTGPTAPCAAPAAACRNVPRVTPHPACMHAATPPKRVQRHAPLEAKPPALHCAGATGVLAALARRGFWLRWRDGVPCVGKWSKSLVFLVAAFSAHTENRVVGSRGTIFTTATPDEKFFGTCKSCGLDVLKTSAYLKFDRPGFITLFTT